MHRRHKTMIGIGVVLLLAGWFAWAVLLTESEEPASVQQQQG